MKRTVIAVSMGDPAGVGPEIALASMADAEVWERGTPLLVGDLSFTHQIASLSMPGLWIGAIAGAAKIFVAIRLRRWRDEG